MAHDLFRHVEMELFVRSQHLEGALRFLRQVLTIAGSDEVSTDEAFRDQLASVDGEVELNHLAGKFCHHYPICVRRILADDTMISMASPASTGDPTDTWYSISLINYHTLQRSHTFEQLSTLLARSMGILFGARPHWGKLCPLPNAEIRELYPRFANFARLCHDADPDEVFRNDWTQELLGGRQTSSADLPTLHETR